MLTNEVLMVIVEKEYEEIQSRVKSTSQNKLLSFLYQAQEQTE